MLNIINRYESGPLPSLRILFAGRNSRPHKLTVKAGPSSGNLRTVDTVFFEGYYNEYFESDINWSDISAAGQLYVHVEVTGVESADRASISYLGLVGQWPWKC